MFGFRTPVKSGTTKDENPQKMTTESTTPSRSPSVRKSIGEWESGMPDALHKNSITQRKAASVEPPKLNTKTSSSQESGSSKATVRRVSVEPKGSPPKQEKSKYMDRLTEARACVTKAKLQIGNSRNLKTEIKTEVIQAVERLFQLVKEAETVKGQGKKQASVQEKENPEKEKLEVDSVLIKRIEEHAKLMQENNERMERLKESLEKQQEIQERQTYASVTAESSRKQPHQRTALHSVVVTSKDENETGEQVLERIRNVVDAKKGDVTVEKIRKAKDKKVILGCRTEEERQKIKERLRKAEEHLTVEEMKNKDPTVILRDVLHYNSDEDIINALRNQNKDILKDLDEKVHKIEIAYKKRTRNPHTSHVILRVSPKVWQRMTHVGSVRIDLQRVRVADQSPLVQCSLCLGYGHGRRFCKESIEKCSHCGGPHMSSKCADWLAGAPPTCCNCMHAKLEKIDHNAFSQECVIRRKWDALARATVAYC